MLVQCVSLNPYGAVENQPTASSRDLESTEYTEKTSGSCKNFVYYQFVNIQQPQNYTSEATVILVYGPAHFGNYNHLSTRLQKPLVSSFNSQWSNQPVGPSPLLPSLYCRSNHILPCCISKKLPYPSVNNQPINDYTCNDRIEQVNTVVDLPVHPLTIKRELVPEPEFIDYQEFHSEQVNTAVEAPEPLFLIKRELVPDQEPLDYQEFSVEQVNNVCETPVNPLLAERELVPENELVDNQQILAEQVNSSVKTALHQPPPIRELVPNVKVFSALIIRENLTFEMQQNQVIEHLDAIFDKLCLSSYATKLPTFSGEQGGSGLMSFLQNFIEISKIMGLTAPRMARLLPAHLKGTAKAVFDNFTDAQKENWDTIVAALRSHFATSHFLDTAREKLMDLGMRNGESPTLFSSRVRRNVLEAYPEANEEDTRKFLRSVVLKNGISPKIKQKLKLLGPLPADYDDLLKESERVYDLIQTEENSVGDSLLMEKVDKILDNMSSAPINSIYRGNSYRPPYNNPQFRSRFRTPRNTGRYKSPFNPRQKRFNSDRKHPGIPIQRNSFGEDFDREAVSNVHYIESKASDILLMGKQKVIQALGGDRKVSLVTFAHSARVLFVQLLEEVKWVKSSKSSNHVPEELVVARLSAFQAIFAVDLLTKFAYLHLLAMIQERFTLKPKISSVNEANFAAIKSGSALSNIKVASSLFPLIKDIKNGMIILTIPEEFEVHLTVLGERESIQWTLLNIKMLVKTMKSLWSQTRAFFAAEYATQVLQSRTDIAKNVGVVFAAFLSLNIVLWSHYYI
ncbi:unnamed protein product [Cylicocyclus nassatus]|uniref:Uncharacterized protein n=1 Tax=Cylicocyclus nassatus TaxID=53992 RepID=A0AA36GPK8_CYLNA|nr:unnamed protein product [Cylicocyclus nassatus]